MVNQKHNTSEDKAGRRRLRAVLIAVCIVVIAAVAFTVIYLTVLSPKKNQSSEEKIEREYKEVTDIGDRANAMYIKLKQEEGKEAAEQKTVEWLKQQESIEETGVGKGCIWFTFKNGAMSIIYTGESE